MSDSVRILLVEDSEDDAVLIIRKLKADGLDPDWIRVEEAGGLRNALRQRAWDIVLADYALPHFSGTAALALIKETGLDIPVILVSGTIGEDIAIEAMRAGAVDYIMKDKPGRLAPSIRREMAEARNRREKRRADEDLHESALRWKSTFDAITDAICLLDADGRMLQCNKAHQRFLNKPEAEIIGEKCHRMVHGLESFLPDCPFQRMLASKSHEEAEVFEQGRWMYVAVDPILDESGVLTGAVHIMADVSPRKKAEALVQASLREKEILLREVHHRVKNNMQIMVSLLNLQARSLKDPIQAELLKESQSRIRTMSIVHEKLYRSGDLSRIDFADYIESLAVHLFQFLAVDLRRISLRRETEAILLDINNAIPCGLIVNELVSNSIKHGFPDGRVGEVMIKFQRLQDGRLLLAVRDDGAGFPAGLDYRAAESMGLQLVNLLVGQLDGTLELIRDGGTEFRIVFVEQIPKPRV
ncbi:MAG: response regulator [Candidatus Aminicenantes bacterium]|nr:response regulator [Candidatus Aminicenantes bacterium]